MSGKRKRKTDASSLFDAGEDVNALFESGEDATPTRQDWGDAANSGASVQQPPVGPESVATATGAPPPEHARLYDFLRAGAQAAGMDPLGLIPDERTVRGAVASALQGPTMNWADEAAGLLSKRDAALANLLKPRSEQVDPDWAYRHGRDAFRQVESGFRDEHPLAAFGLTTVAGALSNPVSVQGGRALNLARYAPAAAQGALAAAGATPEADTMARSAAAGAPLGAAGQALGEVAGELGGRAVGALSDRLRDWASEAAAGRAVKAATGQNKRVLKQMVERGLNGADTGTVDAVGRDLLDEGVVTAGASTDEILHRAAAAREQAGQQITQALADLDSITPPGRRISADQIANDAERQLLAPLLNGTHGQQQLAERLAPEIDALRQRGVGQTGEVSFQDLEDFRRGLDESINWAKTEPTPVQGALRRLRTMVNDALEQHAESMSAAAGSDAGQRYLDAKRLYGSMATTTQAARDNVAGQISNRMVSPTDYGVGLSTAAGALANGQGLSSVALGFGAGALNHLARTRGNQVAAAGLNSLSSSDWLQSMASTNPGVLGQYLGTLSAAAARSPEALGQVHNQLSETDPEYQQRMRALGGQGQ